MDKPTNRMCDQVTAAPEEYTEDWLADAQACPLRTDPNEPECEACQ